MPFFQELQQASWRGIPFGVTATNAKFGRKVAVHEYPLRDEVWVEDLGRAKREFDVIGFLLENDIVYNGGDVIQQRKYMIDACEAVGSGALVHPTYGTVTASLLDCTIGEDLKDGQYFELKFRFIRTGAAIYPSTSKSTQSVVNANSLLAGVAAAADFATRAIADVKQGLSVIETAVATVHSWISTASNLANDATGIFNSVVGLSGSFGRFFGSSLTGFIDESQITVGPAPTASVDSLLGAATVNRANVVTASAALTAAAANLGDPSAMASAVQAVATAVLSTAASPVDGIRLLTSLADFTPDLPMPNYSIGAAMQDIQDACGDLCRRAAVVALAQCAATYQPSSSNDAVTTRNAVVAILDNEIEIAGDQGEDATFNALRTLRASVVQDLNTRGAALPSIQTFSFKAMLPAPVLAQQMYRDPSRADQLVTQANPPHPAFMPTSFQALSA